MDLATTKGSRFSRLYHLSFFFLYFFCCRPYSLIDVMVFCSTKILLYINALSCFDFDWWVAFTFHLLCLDSLYCHVNICTPYFPWYLCKNLLPHSFSGLMNLLLCYSLIILCSGYSSYKSSRYLRPCAYAGWSVGSQNRISSSY